MSLAKEFLGPFEEAAMKRCVFLPTKSGEFLQFLALLAVQVAGTSTSSRA